MSRPLHYMFITGDADMARRAEACGVERIFVDMEVLGKAERQGHLDTHKACHTLDQVSAVRAVITKAELMVRINPLHEGTAAELDALCVRGVDRVMLPMFTRTAEVTAFLALLQKRIPVTLLVETPQALVRLPEWLPLLDEHDQVHFGLNDLSLAMGLDFLFEPMSARLFDIPARQLKKAGIAFGIGGIARIGVGELPAEWVLGEHVRLGSSQVILSRAFREGELDLQVELDLLRSQHQQWQLVDLETLRQNQQRLAERVFDIASRRRAAQG